MGGEGGGVILGTAGRDGEGREGGRGEEKRPFSGSAVATAICRLIVN